MIRWETPRPAKGGLGLKVWVSRLEPLMEKPGEWALVHETRDKSAAAITNLRRRRYCIPPGRWEFTSRANGEGGRLIYARYLGPDEDDALGHKQ